MRTHALSDDRYPDGRAHFVATVADSDAPVATEAVYGYIDQYMEEQILPLARPASRVYFRYVGPDSDLPPVTCVVAAFARGDYNHAWLGANGRPA